MAKYLFALTLLLCLSVLSSCGSSSGCRGGGWYGDRNLTKITPVQSEDVETKNFSIPSKP